MSSLFAEQKSGSDSAASACSSVTEILRGGLPFSPESLIATPR
jgi:hypothetical protein